MENCNNENLTLVFDNDAVYDIRYDLYIWISTNIILVIVICASLVYCSIFRKKVIDLTVKLF